MFLSTNVSSTKNAYYAFYAVLQSIKKFNNNCDKTKKIYSIIYPRLGTGVGRITCKESISQIKEAIDDFIINKNNCDLFPKLDNCYICNKNN